MSDLPMNQEDHPVHNVPEPTEKYAGDVVPIRSPGDPANNAGRQNQIKNQQRQSPNTNAPGSNIARIYG